MTATERPISKGDIEAKLRALQGEATHAEEAAKGVATAVGVTAVVVVVVLAYVFGRRRGRKGRTVIEVRPVG